MVRPKEIKRERPKYPREKKKMEDMIVKDKNHHMIIRKNTWYFVTKVNGRRVRKALSQSITEARILRDEYIRDIKLTGDIRNIQQTDEGAIVGELAVKWDKIMTKKVRPSTMIDYKSAMNTYILPEFGNTPPIKDITCLDVEEMIIGMLGKAYQQHSHTAEIGF